MFLVGSPLQYVNTWNILKDTYGSSVQCTVPYCSVMSNKAVQIDLLHQQTEIQDKDETCLQQLISVRSESHFSIFSSLKFDVVRRRVGGSRAYSTT